MADKNGNTGSENTGENNSGDLNSGNRNSGYLNSDTPTVRMFNRDTGIKFEDISIPNFLLEFSPVEWVEFSKMTDAEKKEFPKAYVCDGYLKKHEYKTAWANLWAKATTEQKKSVEALPNFDAKIFEEITGIKIGSEDSRKSELLRKADELIAKASELKAEAQKL